MNKKHKIVDMQETSEIVGSADAYERYVGDEREDVLANPDLLPEQSTSPSSPQLLMGEAISHLQGRQKEVYIAIMRNDKSQAETADLLGVGRTTVQVHLDRAIAFISAYCKAAMSKERI